jgi:hypothetical protein
MEKEGRNGEGGEGMVEDTGGESVSRKGYCERPEQDTIISAGGFSNMLSILLSTRHFCKDGR